jgi:hypothetical protein
MSADLIARLRKQREGRLVIEPFTFTFRRPTDVEMIAIGRGGLDWAGLACDYVVGWEGVTDGAIAGGGGTNAVAFDAALWREWCADRPDFWTPLGQAILEAYTLHQSALSEAAKK